MIIRKKEKGSVDVIMRAIGKIYRRARSRIDVSAMGNCVMEESRDYRDDVSFVSLIERTLLESPPEKRNLLVRTYFMAEEKNWYIGLYTRSTYYRLLKEASEEFIEALDI